MFCRNLRREAAPKSNLARAEQRPTLVFACFLGPLAGYAWTMKKPAKKRQEDAKPRRNDEFWPWRNELFASFWRI